MLSWHQVLKEILKYLSRCETIAELTHFFFFFLFFLNSEQFAQRDCPAIFQFYQVSTLREGCQIMRFFLTYSVLFIANINNIMLNFKHFIPTNVLFWLERCSREITFAQGAEHLKQIPYSHCHRNVDLQDAHTLLPK